MTEFLQKLPEVSGAALNENGGNSHDGRVEINLRGILAKETLVFPGTVVVLRLLRLAVIFPTIPLT